MTVLDKQNVWRPLPLRVEDFFLLHERGALADYGKTELIDGAIVYMNSQFRPHGRVKHQIDRQLEAALVGSGLSVMAEVTIAIPPHSAPEPDLVVTSEPEGDGPIPLASVRLVVEVADTTLAGDLGRKATLYAAGGIAEYWVADLAGRALHQHWEPLADGYAQRRVVPWGAPVTAETLADVTIDTDRLG